jgi:hypothetical protein
MYHFSEVPKILVHNILAQYIKNRPEHLITFIANSIFQCEKWL